MPFFSFIPSYLSSYLFRLLAARLPASGRGGDEQDLQGG